MGIFDQYTLFPKNDDTPGKVNNSFKRLSFQAAIKSAAQESRGAWPSPAVRVPSCHSRAPAIAADLITA